MNSAIVDYAPEFSEREIIDLRVEMPLANIDLESLEDMIREALTGFQIEVGPYFNEQSDKEHVIILIKLSVPTGQRSSKGFSYLERGSSRHLRYRGALPRADPSKARYR
jgi:hypothetical protein